METALYKAAPFHLWKQRRVPVRNEYHGLSVFSKSFLLSPECPPYQCNAQPAPVRVRWNMRCAQEELGLSAASQRWEKGSLQALLGAWQRDGAWPQGHCREVTVPQAGACRAVSCCPTCPCQSHACQKRGILFKADQADSGLKGPIQIPPLPTPGLDQTWDFCRRERGWCLGLRRGVCLTAVCHTDVKMCEGDSVAGKNKLEEWLVELWLILTYYPSFQANMQGLIKQKEKT